MDLILLRHGNTFEPGNPVRWLGEDDDPPLTAIGQMQMFKAGQGLAKADLAPGLIYAAPYQRTLYAAQIVADCCEIRETTRIEPRLRELNYGQWTGLTNDQIELRYGAKVLKAWLGRGAWPKDCEWGRNSDSLVSETIVFTNELFTAVNAQQNPVLLISTNGRLRFFLKLVGGAFEKQSEKDQIAIQPGRISHLRHDEGGWRLMCWNTGPTEL